MNYMEYQASKDRMQTIKRVLLGVAVTAVVIGGVACVLKVDANAKELIEENKRLQEQQVNDAYNKGYINGSEAMYKLLHDISDRNKRQN